MDSYDFCRAVSADYDGDDCDSECEQFIQRRGPVPEPLTSDHILL
jgi:hypothetical protein